MPSVEERVGKLETRFAVTAAVVATLTGVLGVSSVVLLPRMAKDAADNAMKDGAGAEFKLLLAQAKADYQKMSKISKDNTIEIDGRCFKPRKFIRCNRDSGAYFDTWADIGCGAPWVKDRDGEMLVIAQCDSK